MKEYFEEYTRISSQTILTFDGKEMPIMDCGQVILDCFNAVKNRGSSVYFIGNGGSAAIAQHMCADFLKNGGMSAISLYNGSTLTCFGNDCGYEEVFAKQIYMYAKEGDLLVAISSSGNSENIIRAINEGKSRGCKIITFTGFEPNNRARSQGDINVYVPSMDYGIVESIHNMILQYIVDKLKFT